MAGTRLPVVFFTGVTEIRIDGLKKFFEHIGIGEYFEEIQAAHDQGLTFPEIYVAIMAKLCYKSFDEKLNPNLTRVRELADTVKNAFTVAHMSICEHINFNFIIADCSRVFTHELVRHRVGVAYSQESGRYCRLTEINIVEDPYLRERIGDLLPSLQLIEDEYRKIDAQIDWDNLSMSNKKTLTSAMRRIAPNGLCNSIGFTVNVRELRHVIMMRTNRAAEWEARFIANQLYESVKAEFPLFFFDAKEEMVNGLIEVTGMKNQPY